MKDNIKDFNEVNEFSVSKSEDNLNVEVVVELIDNVYPSYISVIVLELLIVTPSTNKLHLKQMFDENTRSI